MKPGLLIYCQHSVGIGHLTRSFAIAAALTSRFHVTFLNGGPLPQGIPVPAGVDVEDLPALGMTDGHTLVGRDGVTDVAAARHQRRARVLQIFERTAPAVLLVELFPFGRKKFAFELLPLLKLARARRVPPLVVSSLRDILVASRPDQQHHDDRAEWICRRYFDAVMVHADPQLAKLEETFRPRRPLVTPVHYTGLVVPEMRRTPIPLRAEKPILVSAGGGSVGFPLFRAALAAHSLLDPATAPPLRIIAGPFLPDDEWQALQSLVATNPRVSLERAVPDLIAEMRGAAVSLSQCGYNTALDIVRAGVPALVVPYGAEREDEQRNRAQRLESLGAMRCLLEPLMTPERLAEELRRTLTFRPRPNVLQLDGANATAELLHRLSIRAPESVACATG